MVICCRSDHDEGSGENGGLPSLICRPDIPLCQDPSMSWIIPVNFLLFSALRLAYMCACRTFIILPAQCLFGHLYGWAELLEKC